MSSLYNPPRKDQNTGINWGLPCGAGACISLLGVEEPVSELLLGIFKREPTPPLCSEEGAKVFCHRAIQWFNRNCLIFLIWKINQT